jgi:cytochrome c553
MLSLRSRSGSLASRLKKGPFLAAVAACYVGPIDSAGTGTNGAAPAPSNADGGGPSGSTGPSGSAGQSNANTGLPCEVDALLAKRCRTCHGPGGSPMSLVSYEDLTAPSKSDATKTVAVKAIERMRSATSPMPPSGERASEAEIAAVEAWVAAKTPRGECGASSADGGTTGPAKPAPVVCTSGQTWTSNKEGPSMHPGRACINCHENQEDDPVVWAGGTVYPTLHEEDGCYGIAGGATVVITDKNGRIVELPVGPTGNFSLKAENSAPLAMPIRAKVVRNGVERVMATPQNSADCNACHTEQGANGAPGRILVP